MNKAFAGIVFGACVVFAAINDEDKSSRRNFITHFDHGGYNYPVPNPPVSFDEPQQLPPANSYLPPPNVEDPPLYEDIPQVIPTYVPPAPYPHPIDLLPPLFEPLPTIDLPIQPPNQGYLPPSTSYGVPISEGIQFRVYNMSCLDSPTRRFFKASISTSYALDSPPVVEDAKSGCVVGAGNNFLIDVDGFRMSKCGIKYCSGADKNLCVQLRAAQIRGLKLPDDPMITLQCKPQDVVVEKTRHFKINPQHLMGRSAGTVATGGSQRNFETDVALYRKAPGTKDFSQLVSSGSTVHLGEELLLKATVRDGDGWKYSRMGAVVMQRVLHGAKTSQGASAVTLVDSKGCRVAGMRSICPEHPRQINPLTTTMPFKAFMFQGAHSGDEMVLSVRMLGCLHFEDCYQARSCEEKAVGRTRAKRRAETGSTNATSDWQSFLEFRVVLPSEKRAALENRSQFNPTLVLGGVGAACVTGLALIAFFIARNTVKNKH